MDMILFFFAVISFLYCCDWPVISGFELFINDHNSLTYGICLSIISAYIFYFFQVFIPKVIRFLRVLNIAWSRLNKIEKTMEKALCCLQGVFPNSEVTPSKEKIAKRLDEIDIFSTNSGCVIMDHKEYSVFEAVFYYNSAISNLVDEIISCQYLPSIYERHLVRLKGMVLFEHLERWHDYLPGEYIRHNQATPGYLWVNPQVVKSDILASIDEYIKIYNIVSNTSKKLYNFKHYPLAFIGYIFAQIASASWTLGRMNL